MDTIWWNFINITFRTFHTKQQVLQRSTKLFSCTTLNRAFVKKEIISGNKYVLLSYFGGEFSANLIRNIPSKKIQGGQPRQSNT